MEFEFEANYEFQAEIVEINLCRMGGVKGGDLRTFLGDFMASLKQVASYSGFSL